MEAWLTTYETILLMRFQNNSTRNLLGPPLCQRRRSPLHFWRAYQGMEPLSVCYHCVVEREDITWEPVSPLYGSVSGKESFAQAFTPMPDY